MPASRPLHIGVDARELVGKPTGVGRYLSEILRAWLARGTFSHRLTLFLPAPLGASADPILSALPAVVLPSHASGNGVGAMVTAARRSAARRDVLLAPGLHGAASQSPCPIVAGHLRRVVLCAHPEWFGWREGMRRRWVTRRSARRAAKIVTTSQFSRDEIVRYLGVAPDSSIVLVPPGPPQTDRVADSGRTRAADSVCGLAVQSASHIPDLLAGCARAFAARQIPGARLVLIGDNRTTPRIDPLSIARDLRHRRPRGMAALRVCRRGRAGRRSTIARTSSRFSRTMKASR